MLRFTTMGKLLIIVGIVFIIVGVGVTILPKLPTPGKLPGDIVVEKENFKVFLPITTSILISLILSLLIYLIHRYKN